MSVQEICQKVRLEVARVDGLKRTYGADARDADGLPDGLNEFPCGLVYPGQTIGYKQMAGAADEHTFEVKIELVAGPVGNTKTVAFTLLPMLDLVIARFRRQLTLGGRATYAVFTRQSGFATLTFGGEDYLGYEITLQVVDTEMTTFAPGE